VYSAHPRQTTPLKAVQMRVFKSNVCNILRQRVNLTVYAFAIVSLLMNLLQRFAVQRRNIRGSGLDLIQILKEGEYVPLIFDMTMHSE